MTRHSCLSLLCNPLHQMAPEGCCCLPFGEGALYVASIFPGYNIMALYHQSLPSTERSAALSSKTWKIRILQQELAKLIRVYL